MKRIAWIFVFAVTALVASSAQAQERWPKWYVGLSGYMPFVSEGDVSGAATGDLNFEAGWGGGAAIGYMPAFLNGLRMELEYSYRTNDVDTLGGVSVPDDISANALMFNAAYDFQTGTGWIPYLGGGLGFADMELNLPTAGVTDEDDTVFAYQLMAGVGYAPQLMPRTVWSLGYRYFGTSDPEFSGTAGTIETEYNSHNIELGARFIF